jgi:Tfp pilus assembly protein PilO
MNTLLWHLRQWGRRFGRSGLTGLALLIVAGLIQADLHTRRDETLAQKRNQLAALSLAARNAQQAEESPSSQVNVIDTLPADAKAPWLIGQLEQIARNHGLRFYSGKYTQAPVAGTPLLRWQLSLPLEASYPEIRAFIDDSLRQLPALALDEFKLARDSIESTDLEASLRFNLYVHEAAP